MEWGSGEFKINQGIYAVFCFYMISGFFTALIFDRFEDNLAGVRKFYLDRFLRLMPVFWVVIIFAIFLDVIQPGIYPNQQQGELFNFRDLSHAFLQPLSNVVAYFTGGDFAMGRWFVISPVASLALEVQFFIIFPLLRSISINYIISIIFVGLVWVLYAASIGGDILESATYRHVIGILPLFLTGFIFYLEKIKQQQSKYLNFDYICIVFGVSYLLAIYIFRPSPIAWLEEMALAFLTCPLIFRLALIKRSNKIDHLMGYLAYGIFLVHIPIIRYFDFEVSYINFVITMIIATLLALIIHFLVEKPILKIRHKRAQKVIESI